MVISDDMLEQSLLRLSDIMSSCRDPWCIFGGTAMRLHGFRDTPIADIDVLASPRDAARLTTIHGIPDVADGGTVRFRSSALLHPDLGAVPVEILAGFEIFAGDAWKAVDVAERVDATFGRATVPIAGLHEIAAIFRLSGRPKDLPRLKLIEAGVG